MEKSSPSLYHIISVFTDQKNAVKIKLEWELNLYFSRLTLWRCQRFNESILTKRWASCRTRRTRTTTRPETCWPSEWGSRPEDRNMSSAKFRFIFPSFILQYKEIISKHHFIFNEMYNFGNFVSNFPWQHIATQQIAPKVVIFQLVFKSVEELELAGKLRKTFYPFSLDRVWERRTSIAFNWKVFLFLFCA